MAFGAYCGSGSNIIKSRKVRYGFSVIVWVSSWKEIAFLNLDPIGVSKAYLGRAVLGRGIRKQSSRLQRTTEHSSKHRGFRKWNPETEEKEGQQGRKSIWKLERDPQMNQPEGGQPFWTFWFSSGYAGRTCDLLPGSLGRWAWWQWIPLCSEHCDIQLSLTPLLPHRQLSTHQSLHLYGACIAVLLGGQPLLWGHPMLGPSLHCVFAFSRVTMYSKALLCFCLPLDGKSLMN